MCDVDAAVLMRDFGQLDNFARPGKTRGHVLQRSRNPKRAVLHRVGDQFFHLLELSRRRRPIVIADHEFAYLGRADKGAEVDARALLIEAFEILVQRAPIDCKIEPAIEIFLLLQNPIIDWSNGFAFAGYLCGDAHHDFAHRPGIDQHVLLRLSQHVDETGRDDLSARVDFALSLRAP